jgi:predicted secreted Zn-dependent protease
MRQAVIPAAGGGLRAVSVASLAMLAVAVSCGEPALAKPVTTTKIVHYSVSASTASGLDEQMSSLGPYHGSERAYANIVVRPNYDGKLVQGRYCRIENFKVTADFTMTLPVLASGIRLNKSLNRKWKSFSTFARRHEETHRAIWLECLAKAERRVRALRVADCGALNGEVDRVFETEWQICERRQMAFDAAERTKLMRHPLMVAASRVKRAVATDLAPRSSSNRRAFRYLGRN